MQPDLTFIAHLSVTVGEPIDLGQVSDGHRRLVPILGGTVEGPLMKGIILPGSDGNGHTACGLVYHRTPCTTRFNTLVYDKTAFIVRGGLFNSRSFFLTIFFLANYFIFSRVDP